MYPQLVQNGTDKVNPSTQRTKATNDFGYCWPHFVSLITVAVASTILKAESTPKEKRVRASRIIQKFGALIVSMADG